MKTDIQIAQEAKIVNIMDIAKKIGLGEDDVEQYGKYKAKVDLKVLRDLENKKDMMEMDIQTGFPVSKFPFMHASPQWQTAMMP